MKVYTTKDLSNLVGTIVNDASVNRAQLTNYLNRARFISKSKTLLNTINFDALTDPRNRIARLDSTLVTVSKNGDTYTVIVRIVSGDAIVWVNTLTPSWRPLTSGELTEIYNGLRCRVPGRFYTQLMHYNHKAYVLPKEGAILFDSKDKKSKAIMTIPQYQTVTIIEYYHNNNCFHKVVYNGKIGYVWSPQLYRTAEETIGCDLEKGFINWEKNTSEAIVVDFQTTLYETNFFETHFKPIIMRIPRGEKVTVIGSYQKGTCFNMEGFVKIKYNGTIGRCQKDDLQLTSNKTVGINITIAAMNRYRNRDAYGTAAPNVLDNAGFIYYAHKAAGVMIPRSAKDMYNKGKIIDKRERAKPGDVICFLEKRDSATNVPSMAIITNVRGLKVRYVGILKYKQGFYAPGGGECALGDAYSFRYYEDKFRKSNEFKANCWRPPQKWPRILPYSDIYDKRYEVRRFW